MDAYPPIPPKQVTVSCVHLISYGFLQTPPLASDALAIRIVFPLVWVTPLSFKRTGFPALLGKQKSQTIFMVWLFDFQRSLTVPNTPLLSCLLVPANRVTIVENADLASQNSLD